jgi:hypothetical protein
MHGRRLPLVQLGQAILPVDLLQVQQGKIFDARFDCRLGRAVMFRVTR